MLRAPLRAPTYACVNIRSDSKLKENYAEKLSYRREPGKGQDD